MKSSSQLLKIVIFAPGSHNAHCQSVLFFSLSESWVSSMYKPAGYVLYKVFLLLTAGKSVWELSPSLHCFVHAVRETASCQYIPYLHVRCGPSAWISTPGWGVEVWMDVKGERLDPSSAEQSQEHVESCISWIYRGFVLLHRYIGWKKSRWWSVGSGGALRGWRSNPRLLLLLPELPQRLSPVAWSTPRRSSPGTGWGAALLLRCGWSGLHPGRSETQSRWDERMMFGCFLFFLEDVGYVTDALIWLDFTVS